MKNTNVLVVVPLTNTDTCLINVQPRTTNNHAVGQDISAQSVSLSKEQKEMQTETKAQIRTKTSRTKTTEKGSIEPTKQKKIHQKDTDPKLLKDFCDFQKF